MTNNKITISGIIGSSFMFNHEYYNERFYQFILSVKRTSGVNDLIPVIVSERLIDADQDLVGTPIEIIGEFRSFNDRSPDKTKLLLFIFPLEIRFLESEENTNEIILTGTIVKRPTLRNTPNDRTISDILLAVHRNCNKSDYLPCIAWGRTARFISSLDVGDVVTVTGRVQSRDYNKDGEIRRAYEVSINYLEL